MARSLWLMDVIYDEFRSDRDVPVTARPGWETNGSSDADHQGVLDHHTGSAPGSRFDSLVKWMAGGGYPYGFACNIATGSPYAPDLTNFPIVVTASGYASHAGVGSFPWVVALGLRGSAAMLGIEHYSTYDHVDWHPRHLEVQMRLDACLLEHMGRSWARRGDHLEWATPAGRKSDRHHIDTVKWDRDLAALMASRLSGSNQTPEPPTPAPAPPPPVIVTPPEGELSMADIDNIMARLDALARDLPAAVWNDLHPHARQDAPKDRAWQVLQQATRGNKIIADRIVTEVRAAATRGGTPDEIAERVRARVVAALAE